MRAVFRRRYGAGPGHLLGHLLLFAVAAFALDQILAGGGAAQFVEWFVGFALLHDLVLVPLYTGIDRLAGARVSSRSGSARSGRVSVVNHIRAPALIAGVLLLVYAPRILDRGDATYIDSSGHQPTGYLRNWLLISACLFLISALTYLARTWRAARS